MIPETRMGGFKPVRQHSMVAGILADMAIGIDMIRASVYNLSYMLVHLDVTVHPGRRSLFLRLQLHGSLPKMRLLK